MIGFRGLLELVLGWLPFAQLPPVPACVVATDRLLTRITLSDRVLTEVDLSDRQFARITLEDSCR